MAVSLEIIMILVAFPANASNPSVCKIIPLKNSILFGSTQVGKITFKFLLVALKADPPVL